VPRAGNDKNHSLSFAIIIKQVNPFTQRLASGATNGNLTTTVNYNHYANLLADEQIRGKP